MLQVVAPLEEFAEIVLRVRLLSAISVATLMARIIGRTFVTHSSRRGLGYSVYTSAASEDSLLFGLFELIRFLADETHLFDPDMASAQQPDALLAARRAACIGALRLFRGTRSLRARRRNFERARGIACRSAPRR